MPRAQLPEAIPLLRRVTRLLVKVIDYFHTHGVASDTRQRIMDAALELFGSRGFAGTSVVEVERAAGLTGGTGALYRHFRSKDELLLESVRSRLDDWGPYAQFATPEFSAAALIEEQQPGGDLVEKVAALSRLSLIRADHIRDVRRILGRDNTVPQGLLDAFRSRDHEIRAAVVSRTLRDFAREINPTVADEVDWRPLAEVHVGAMAHLWSMRDVFGGEQPCGIDSHAYIFALATAVAAQIERIGLPV